MRYHVVQILALLVMMECAAALAGHVLGIHFLAKWTDNNNMIMPVPTAVCLLLVAMALWLMAERKQR